MSSAVPSTLALSIDDPSTLDAARQTTPDTPRNEDSEPESPQSTNQSPVPPPLVLPSPSGHPDIAPFPLTPQSPRKISKTPALVQAPTTPSSASSTALDVFKTPTPRRPNTATYDSNPSVTSLKVTPTHSTPLNPVIYTSRRLPSTRLQVVLPKHIYLGM